MSWTSHDRFFGYLNSFRINRNNHFFGGNKDINDRPYPVIINRPTYQQVVNNWNFADTGAVLTFFFIGLFVSKRFVRLDHGQSLVDNRVNYKRYHRAFVAFGIAFGLRNSCYRLEGYVANGLPKKPIDDLVKYDFTSELINSTFWRYIVDTNDKPKNL